MKLYIDDTDLRRLIEEKRDYIGRKSRWVEILDAAVLLMSAFTGNYDNLRIPAPAVRTAFCLVALINIVVIVQEIWTMPNYNKEQMIRDIEALDMKDRRSSIVAIQKEDNNRKYLVYDNPAWGFRMFPSFKTQDYENEKNITERLAKELNIKKTDIAVHHKGTGNEQKFATAHNETRAYDYNFYSADLSMALPTDDFEIDGRHYYWMTIQEMLNDDAIREHNEYIVERVNDLT